MKRDKGFSLIELMIVVEIIAIIAAIAFPDYIRTRIQANESAAVGRLKVITQAQTQFFNSNLRYTDQFTELTEANPPYLTPGAWDSNISGYQYSMTLGDNNFSASAVPVSFGNTGWRGFYVDSSGVIKWRMNEAASEDDTPLGD